MGLRCELALVCADSGGRFGRLPGSTIASLIWSATAIQKIARGAAVMPFPVLMDAEGVLEDTLSRDAAAHLSERTLR